MSISPQSQPAAAPSRKFASRSDLRYGIVLTLVIAFALAHMLKAESGWLFNKNIVAFSRGLPRMDKIDIPMLLGALSEKTTFASTFAWWHESWTRQTAYWRPLTMQSFWLEKRLFGLDRYDRWMWVSFALGAAFAALLGIYVRVVTGRRDLALLSVALFTLPSPLSLLRNIVSSGPNSDLVLGTWKDQPDLWANCLTLAALILLHRRRFAWALACGAAAVCFKESGWLVFPLSLVQLIATRRLREMPLWVYGAAAAVILTLLGFRYSAGPAVMRGYHMGSNQHWHDRYVNALEGVYFSMMFTLLPGWLLGHAAVGGILAVKRFGPARGMLAFAAMAFLVAVYYARADSLTLPEAVAGLLDPENNLPACAAVTALWLFGAAALARNRPLLRRAAYFFVLSAIAATPFVAATQVLAHALHLATSFESVIGAAMTLAVAERIQPWAQGLVAGRSGPDSAQASRGPGSKA